MPNALPSGVSMFTFPGNREHAVECERIAGFEFGFRLTFASHDVWLAGPSGRPCRRSALRSPRDGWVSGLAPAP